MKLVAVIIAYQPNIEELKRNLRGSAGGVDAIVIWFNSPISKVLDKAIAEWRTEYKNLIIRPSESNKGIAGGVNAVAKWALSEQFTHLLTLDQDSYFDPIELMRFRAEIDEYNGGVYDIHCPNPKNNGRFSYEGNECLKVVGDAITSGSIFNLSLWGKVGGFDERLMIDGVDYEYCYRVKKQGVKTVIHTRIVLNQQFGYLKKSRLGFYTINYSPFRTYMIVRNHLIVWRRYPNCFSTEYKRRLIKDYIILRIFKIILAEEGKWNKLMAVFYGIKDAFKLNYAGIRRYIKQESYNTITLEADR